MKQERLSSNMIFLVWVNANMFTGAIAGGVTGVVTGLSVAVFYSNVNALVESGVQLSAGNNIDILAVIGEKEPVTTPGKYPEGSEEKGFSSKLKRDESMSSAMDTAYKAGFNMNPSNSKFLLFGVSAGGGVTGVAVNGGALVVMSKIKAVLAGKVVHAKNLTVETRTLYTSVFAGSGALAGGATGVSASVAIIYYDADIETSISGGASISETEKINVLTTGNMNGTAMSASLAAGALAVNAGISVGVNTSKALTYIGQGVQITGDTTDINLDTVFDIETMVNTFGVTAGATAIGPGVAVAVENLKSYTFIGTAPSDSSDSDKWVNTVGIRGTAPAEITARDITIGSEVKGKITAAYANLAAGALAVSVAVVVAINEVKNRAGLCDKKINAHNISITSILTGDVDVALGTGTAGGVAVGANVIVGQMKGINEAVIDAGSKEINASGSITVHAGTLETPSDITVNAQSYILAAGGATGSANVVLAFNEAVNNAIVRGAGSSGKLTLTGNLDVRAYGFTAAHAYAYTANIGGVGVGATVVYASLESIQQALVDTAAEITARNIIIFSEQNSMEKKCSWTLSDVFSDVFNPMDQDSSFSIPTASKTDLAQAYIFYASEALLSIGANVAIAKADATSKAVLSGKSIKARGTIDVENTAKSTAYAETAPVGIALAGISVAVQVAHAYADGTFIAEIRSTGSYDQSSGKGGIIAEGTDLFIIHEGRKVQILDASMKEWVEIRLEDGNTGWVPVNVMEII